MAGTSRRIRMPQDVERFLPHPYPLPLGEGIRFGAGGQIVRLHASIPRPDFAETRRAWPPRPAGEE